MKLLIDFFPVILFFIAYKIGGIYYATVIAIFASLLQVILYRVRYKKYERTHVISLIILSLSGGATLLFHNPMFIKWKPTSIYWIASLAFFFSVFFSQKPLLQRMMESQITLPSKVWNRLNYLWALFFALLGTANLYVAYNFNTDTWVNFKLFGCTGLFLLFIVLHGLYLPKYMKPESVGNRRSPFFKNGK